ncbi:MAG TPA: ABC transporter substrate-binding protein [Candidatus Nitrosotenuis sp.]|jgi:putative ABC transport system substrate-binding protein|nr:ABC transporter substrate-binding protein [Candidatus Nitrosotenuis sp.]
MKHLHYLLMTLISMVTTAWAEALPVVAITQIVEHGALDTEREGIIEALRQAGYVPGHNVKVIYQNAQGSVVTSSQIAQQLLSQRPKVMVALSTPSSQSLLSVVNQNHIPMVFTAVTDPDQAKLTGNPLITGVCDAVDLDKQIELIQKILPKTNRIGVIYNAGEPNSVVMVKGLQQKIDARHLTMIEAQANKSADIGAAVQTLVGKVDVILIPNDNTAVAAIAQIVQLGIKHKVPVFALDQGSIEQGAAAGYVVDRRNQGLKAGQMVVSILKGKAPQEIPIVLQSEPKLMVNEKSASAMGLVIPADLLNVAIKVNRS